MFDAQFAKILIVDDNEMNRKKLKLAVTRLNYFPEVAKNGAEALAMLRDGDFDTVLLDLLMPEMDGFEVMAHMKADAALREVPIIVISDLEGEAESVSRAISLGAEDFLPKGFDPIILNARLAASLQKKAFRDTELSYFQRIETLTDAAAQIEDGNFDGAEIAGLKAEAESKDPIGTLAVVFHGMAREIHAREVRLQERIRFLLGTMLLAFVALTTSVAPALSRMAAGLGSTPFGMTVWVDLMAGIICLIIAAGRGVLPRLSRSDVGFLFAWAFFVGIIQHGTMFIFAEHVEATYLTLVMAVESLIVFSFAAITRSERANLRRIGGLALGFCGIAIGLYARLESAETAAYLWLFGALLVPAIYAAETIVLSSKRPKHIDPFALIGIMFAFSLTFAVPIAFLTGQWLPAGSLWSPLGFVIAMFAVSTAAANTGIIYLIDVAGAIFTSQKAYVIALCGMGWGVLLLNESLGVAAWVALGLVFVGMYFVGTKGSDKPIRISRDYGRA
ncbi:MAG: response regulator [Pseudomonadota bacterium]